MDAARAAEEAAPCMCQRFAALRHRAPTGSGDPFFDDAVVAFS